MMPERIFLNPHQARHLYQMFPHWYANPSPFDMDAIHKSEFVRPSHYHHVLGNPPVLLPSSLFNLSFPPFLLTRLFLRLSIAPSPASLLPTCLFHSPSLPPSLSPSSSLTIFYLPSFIHNPPFIHPSIHPSINPSILPFPSTSFFPAVP